MQQVSQCVLLGYDNRSRYEETYERDVCNERDDGAQTWRYGGFPSDHHEPEDYLYNTGVSSSALGKRSQAYDIMQERRIDRLCAERDDRRKAGMIGKDWGGIDESEQDIKRGECNEGCDEDAEKRNTHILETI